ncbi:hypothetical protein PLESTF_000832300 [Pleodorina starrii]|nr:hypothetical protein PLESTF_000832300 [Pleodorina starrii]
MPYWVKPSNFTFSCTPVNMTLLRSYQASNGSIYWATSRRGLVSPNNPNNTVCPGSTIHWGYVSGFSVSCCRSPQQSAAESLAKRLSGGIVSRIKAPPPDVLLLPVMIVATTGAGLLLVSVSVLVIVLHCYKKDGYKVEVVEVVQEAPRQQDA